MCILRRRCVERLVETSDALANLPIELLAKVERIAAEPDPSGHAPGTVIRERQRHRDGTRNATVNGIYLQTNSRSVVQSVNII